MHDIDRTQAEYFDEMQTQNFSDEMEAEGYAGEFEQYNETGEYEAGELTNEFTGELNEYGNEMEFADFEMMNEADEMELASELLEVQNEAELEQFLGKLFRKATPFVGNFLRSSAGRALGGKLKSFLGKNLGNLTALAAQGLNAVVPGAGILAAPLAQRAGNALGNALGLEFEGLSNEDREFETARALVRTGGQAIKQAASMPPGMPGQAVAQAAMSAATRGTTQGSRVRWVRMIQRGNRITFIL